MRNLDRLLRNAKKLTGNTRTGSGRYVHTIKDDYCYYCKGKCQYEYNSTLLLEVDNCRMVIASSPKMHLRSEYENVPDDVLYKFNEVSDVELERIENYFCEMGIHIMNNRRCYSCNGPCKHVKGNNVIRVDSSIEIVETGEYYNGFNDVPNDIAEIVCKFMDKEGI